MSSGFFNFSFLMRGCTGESESLSVCLGRMSAVAWSIHAPERLVVVETVDVVFFKRFPFVPGQRITIEDGPRRGDWEVVAVDDRQVTLRCPISRREFKWDRFCYLVETRRSTWPHGD